MAQDKRHDPILAGKKALVVGIANEHSIAYGCASAFRSLGAELAVTYLNDKAKPHVEPLARRLEAAGAASTSWCTRSPSPPGKTCKAA